MSVSSSALSPTAPTGSVAGAVQVSILEESVQANAQMLATLMESMPTPVHDGRTGGSVDAYA